MKPHAAEAEADLVAACRAGDRQALSQVFRTHTPYLEGLLRRLCGPEGDVEDLLQSTFVAAIRAFPRFRGEAQVRTWLARIAVRKAMERRRKPERRRRVDLALLGETPDHRTAEPERDVAARQRVALLYEHLEAIGPKKRTAFILHVFEGHPIEEVASMVGASVSATKSRVFWARRELFRRVGRDPGLRDLLPEGES